MQAKLKAGDVEVGDILICIEDPWPGLIQDGYTEKVGDLLTVMGNDGSNLYFEGLNKDSYDGCGRSPWRFKMYKKKGYDMNKFKVGDRVKLVSNKINSRNPVGFVGYVRDISVSKFTHETQCRVTKSPEGDLDYANWSYESDLVAYPEVQYEDEWHLNTGQDIPEDADKAWNSDKTSVVAFRYMKKPKKKPKVIVQSKYFRGPEGDYFTLETKRADSHTKMDLIFTDGELTDIKWEKI